MKENIKKSIEEKMNNGDLENVFEMLEAYEKTCPCDRDLWFYQCVGHMMVGELDKAQGIAERCVRIFPTSYEAYYYAGCVFQAQDKVIEAVQCYKIALFLCTYLKNGNEDVVSDIHMQLESLTVKLSEKIQYYIDTEDMDNMLKVSSFLKRESVIWGKYEKAPRSVEKLLVGKEYWVADDDLRYVGVYRAPAPYFIGEENMSLVRTQAEFLKFIQCGNGIKVDGDAEEYLVPIASVEDNNQFYVKQDEEEYNIFQTYAKHFNYYRVKKNTIMESIHSAYYGYPIPLGHDKKRRKLVLSFFVDGLAQEIINGDDFKTLMPNTYAFFSKGTICTNTYSCSEWTFPSLATYESGLNTLNHMMFHNTIDGELPKEVPTLSEYFKKAGYYTSKMDGEWRSIYSYGFARGVDQYVYHIQPMGSRAEQEIINVIEHLETFKETDQYLWMTVGDLHDVADGLDPSLAVQKDLTLDERCYEGKGKTSVKQHTSWRKSEVYKKTARYFDMLFGLLYSYIQNNYSDDEILISLFADHGQGYLVPEDKHFLSKERTKVAFMFRGNGVPVRVTDEIISTADYLPIMCKLADIPLEDVAIDGRLPQIFGGEDAREFAITECLHPGDTYSAVANSNEYEIYFDNGEKTDEEGRFHLTDYTTYGYYRNGEKVIDQQLLDRFEKMFIDRIAERIIYE